jgi:hypothetical protein
VLHNPAQLNMIVRPVEHSIKRLTLMLPSLEVSTFEQLNSHCPADLFTDSFSNPLTDIVVRNPPPAGANVRLLSSVAGLYIGDYGPHGPEIVHLRWVEGGMLCGLKITGDPNVPAGKATFVSSGTAYRSSVASFENCSCGFACACHVLGRLLPPTTPVFSLPVAACRVADTDFVNSRFLPGTVHVLYDPESDRSGVDDDSDNNTRRGNRNSSSSSSSFASTIPTTPLAPPRALLVQWNGFFSTLLKRWDGDVTTIQRLAMNRHL